MKSWAIIEDSSNEEASIVAANEEDMVMGNPDASNAPQETDSVLFTLATVCRKADTVISRFEQMNINEVIEVIVNCNPTAGNIVEGHKIPLPKFLKTKKAAQVSLLVGFLLYYSKVFFQREKEKAGRCVEVIQVNLYH